MTPAAPATRLVQLMHTPAVSAIIAEALTSEATDLLAINSALRKLDIDPGDAASIVTQIELRKLAHSKFGTDANNLLLTRPGLEQATRRSVSDLRARQLIAHGATAVADLTCGLGFDSLAYARHGLRVDAYELDATTADYATHNLKPYESATVSYRNGLNADLSRVDALFADPARRDHTGRRVNDPYHYQPSLQALWERRTEVSIAAIKVGPGIAYRDIPKDARPTWISLDGDVVEATLWYDPASYSSLQEASRVHTALVTSSDATDPICNPVTVATISGCVDGSPSSPRLDIVSSVSALPEYLAEPDGALIRAGLLSTAFGDAGAKLVSDNIAYLALGSPLPRRNSVSLAQNFRILDVLPLNIKKIKQYLRQRNVGSATIKKRGVDVLPETMRKQLGLRGDNHSTVILTRIANEHRAIIVEPLAPRTDQGVE